MKLWQQDAQTLPVMFRPVHGETLYSYTRRLSAANELTHPTTLLRSLGIPARSLNRDMEHCDVYLNELALRRLELYTGTERQHLRKALPILNAAPHEHLDPDVPVVAARPWPKLCQPCDECAKRIPGPKPIIHEGRYPQICRRHTRWVHGHDENPQQHDLSDAREIVSAHRKLRRLRVAHDDPSWFGMQKVQAMIILRRWADSSRHRTLMDRWQARSMTLRPACDPRTSPQVMVFPEMVTLTEIISDPKWRRHVAMANTDEQIASFYRHIANRLEVSEEFVKSVSGTPAPYEPLRDWVDKHRRKHARIRKEFWKSRRWFQPSSLPYPEIRHFK